MEKQRPLPVKLATTVSYSRARSSLREDTLTFPIITEIIPKMHDYR